MRFVLGTTSGELDTASRPVSGCSFRCVHTHTDLEDRSLGSIHIIQGTPVPDDGAAAGVDRSHGDARAAVQPHSLKDHLPWLLLISGPDKCRQAHGAGEQQGQEERDWTHGCTLLFDLPPLHPLAILYSLFFSPRDPGIVDSTWFVQG